MNDRIGHVEKLPPAGRDEHREMPRSVPSRGQEVDPGHNLGLPLDQLHPAAQLRQAPPGACDQGSEKFLGQFHSTEINRFGVPVCQAVSSREAMVSIWVVMD
jgi:hypothetical protein